ncbi:glycosyl hydrolase-related protein [Paenibacillus alkaliterrae]|nr:glycosyl hydrolase-related protein [Paenibacillus alkaliterrae]MCF2937763.1 glycosyl hydrolase-related protein [Paenibacillus alkaliterrae]
MRGEASAAQPFSLISLSSDHIMIDAVKKAENESAMVIRLHEYAGIRGSVELTTGIQIKGWRECDLLERPEVEDVKTDPIVLTFKPYEIKTIMLWK